MQEPHPNGDTEIRLTVIEVGKCRGKWGAWTELEVWFWHHEDAHPRRFRFNVDRHPQILIGDLVRRDPDDNGWLLWWTNRGDYLSRLRVVSDVVQLPLLTD